MRIGILTSSRADFGIYLPLLKKLREDDYFQFDIIAFGTHLSFFHGESVKQIIDQGFEVKYRIESMLSTDSPSSISTAMGLTTIKFADFWQQHAEEFDLILCLGDRYEMFAAVTSGIPFNIVFAHLHGGETTLGAIDNVFRHGITLASRYHFVSTPEYGSKVATLTGNEENIFYVGALGLENLKNVPFLSLKEFKDKWSIDLSIDTILTTFHPETVDFNLNIRNLEELISFICDTRNYQFLITMPNADTMGNAFRKMLISRLKDQKHVFLIENLGTQSYFSAMKYCFCLLGNTSSGIIEAASFEKYVINIGERQLGRAVSGNVIQEPVDAVSIKKALEKIAVNNQYTGINIYQKEDSAEEIINALKRIV